ncbi:MAG: LysR family transcriptional regulator [Shimia sp.]|uniref:LysR family transcriptional regulator n=1 Tax=Shimia sp. TaxID=1954381 RepID=UPI0025D3D6B8|nr:LysR family transcriptional regulator [Shimia sp.]MCH2067205.1 LysR family transcriptional regulator [Shimia sp.]
MSVLPNRPKGPPLNALRAFEAAARFQSFVAAGEELGVTPGAVSQHIKAVEAWAQVTLFRRQAQGVTLTAEGRDVAKAFTRAFDEMAKATQTLRNLSPTSEIHIAALPSVAQLWLPPRLGHLRTLRPELKISVSAMEAPPSLTRDLFDVALFIDNPTENPEERILAEDVLFPVCAPVLLDSHAFTDTPLLHDQTWSEDWRLWSEGTGTDVGDPTAGPKYSLYGLAVEEAKSGAGLLMAHGCLIAPLIETGALCRVSENEVPTGKALVMTLPYPSRRKAGLEEVADLLSGPLLL